MFLIGLLPTGFVPLLNILASSFDLFEAYTFNEYYALVLAWCRVGHTLVLVASVLLDAVMDAFSPTSGFVVLLNKLIDATLFNLFEVCPVGAVLFASSAICSCIVAIQRMIISTKAILFFAFVATINDILIVASVIYSLCFKRRGETHVSSLSYRELTPDNTAPRHAAVEFVYDDCSFCLTSKDVECGKCLCSLCLESMSQQEVSSQFQCVHVFHTACLMNAATNLPHLRCPNCRSTQRGAFVVV